MTEPKYGTPEWDEYVAQVRKELEEDHGEVYDTNEVGKHFKIEGFLAPFCTGTDKETGERVVLAFRHSPRFYWKVG